MTRCSLCKQPFDMNWEGDSVSVDKTKYTICGSCAKTLGSKLEAQYMVLLKQMKVAFDNAVVKATTPEDLEAYSAQAAVPGKPSLTDEEIKALVREGAELRKEMEARIKPMRTRLEKDWLEEGLPQKQEANVDADAIGKTMRLVKHVLDEHGFPVDSILSIIYKNGELRFTLAEKAI